MAFFYLSPLKGTGRIRKPYSDPFRPIIGGRGTGIRASILDLRPDLTRVDGYCIVRTPVAFPDHRTIMITEDIAGPVSRATLSKIERTMRLSLTATDFPSLCLELYALAGGVLKEGWATGVPRPIPPGLHPRSKRLVLGPDVIFERKIRDARGNTIVISDLFNRTGDLDGDTPVPTDNGNLWEDTDTNFTTTTAPKAISGLTESTARIDIVTSDMKAFVTINRGSGSDNSIGLSVAGTDDQFATQEHWATLHEASFQELVAFTNGVASAQDCSSATVTASTDYAITLEYNGGTATSTFPGDAGMSAPDPGGFGATLSTFAGLFMQDLSDNTHAWTSFSVDDLAAAGGPVAGSLGLMGVGI